MKSNLIRTLALTSASLLLGGCSLWPTAQAERDALAELQAQTQWQTTLPTANPDNTGLLALFEQPELHTLIQQALDNNLDLQLAAKRIEEANYNANISTANLWPKLNGSLGRTRSRSAGDLHNTLFNGNLDVSWELDIWGRLLNQRSAAKATAKARLADFTRARDSLAAQTMQGWFNVLTAQQQVEIEQQRLTSLESIQDIIRDRYVTGLGSINDLDAAQRNSAQSKANLAQLQENLKTSKRQLQVLLNQYPNAQLLASAQLPPLQSAPAAGLPADILTQRPDLQAAWQQVLAADANAKASFKDMFPGLRLTGNLGKQSPEFSELMQQPSVWNLAGNLAAPIFNAGQLRNQYKASFSRAEQAYLNYLKVTLTAFQEVESALSQENSLAVREQALAEAVFYARRTYENASEDYGNGVINVLDLINTQLALFNTESQLLNIKNARLQNRVTLALALGQGI